MLVSFIIPSYNSAHTVARCLDSIYALSLKPEEFEVIFIDDCSIDNTCEIVAEYQSKHPNITLLKQPKNNRQGAARNRGVSVAQGEYICFVDSDDTVQAGIVTAILTAKELHTDMTAFHYGNANEHGEIIKEKEKLSFAKGQVFTGIVMQNTHSYWCSGPVPYVYSRTFLKRVDYPFSEGVLYEDSDFVAVHLYYAQRIAYSSKLGYVVYYRECSTTHSMSHKNLADYLLLGTRMLAFYSVISQDIKQNMQMDSDAKNFAEGVLEGACYNVTKSLKRLFKLVNKHELKAYYERVDAKIDRNALYNDKLLHKYPNYWNAWVALCIKHKYLSIALNTGLSAFYKIYQKLKKWA